MANLIKNDPKWFKQKCEDIYDLDKIEKIKRDLRKILEEHPTGVGLAANQIGYLNKVVAIKIDGVITFLVNPVIVQHSKYKFKSNEGCLSFPTITKTVKRYDSIIVHHMDGKDMFEGFNAAVVQHEVDHINGITMVQRSKTSNNKKKKKRRKK